MEEDIEKNPQGNIQAGTENDAEEIEKLKNEITNLQQNITKITEERDEANRLVRNQEITGYKSPSLKELLKEFLGEY